MHPKLRVFSIVATTLATIVLAAPGDAQDRGATNRALNTTANGIVSDNSSVVVAYRRMTESQYRHAIADVFGPEIEINARFEPELREAGLQAVGNAHLSITTSGLEQYLSLARSIADQVVDGERGESIIGCSLTETTIDCANTFINNAGTQLFRRPLSEQDAASFISAYSQGLDGTGKPAKGFKLAIISMLMSPEFLFRVERGEIDPDNNHQYRLDAYSKAARLSYLLWDAAPDQALLSLAASGDIHEPSVLAKQIDRLLGSPRLEQGARAFFTDMLQFEFFDSLTKDGATYPKFSQAVADSAREETLRFMVDHLINQDSDYRDIFTSRNTFLDRSLAAIYNVPFLSKETWAPYEFAEDSERSGVLTQITFLSLFSHPAASSPTVRGVKLHELFMCIELPQPPPDVDFSKVQAIENGTVRERLIEHKTNPGCYGCHNISDPPGLALERFDSLGQYRLLENGVPIDVSAEINGQAFEGSSGLGEFMRGNELVTRCLVRNVHNYGVGKADDPAIRQRLAKHMEVFVDSGYRVKALLRSVLTDPDFYQVTIPTSQVNVPTNNATPASKTDQQDTASISDSIPSITGVAL